MFFQVTNVIWPPFWNSQRWEIEEVNIVIR